MTNGSEAGREAARYATDWVATDAAGKARGATAAAPSRVGPAAEAL